MTNKTFYIQGYQKSLELIKECPDCPNFFMKLPENNSLEENYYYALGYAKGIKEFQEKNKNLFTK
jgi:hypothetical protein